MTTVKKKEIKGVLKSIEPWKDKNEKDHYSLVLENNDDLKYSAWGEVPERLKEGQHILMKYIVNGDYLNIVQDYKTKDPEITIMGGAEPEKQTSFKNGGDISKTDDSMDTFLSLLGMFLEKMSGAPEIQGMSDQAKVKAFACWMVYNDKRK